MTNGVGLLPREPGWYRIRHRATPDVILPRRKTSTADLERDQEEAERELRRLLRQIDAAPRSVAHQLTVGEWLVTWLTIARGEVAPYSFQGYSNAVHFYLIPALGNIRLAALTPEHVRLAFVGWGNPGERRCRPEGLALQTRRGIFAVLKNALGRAAERDLIKQSPCKVVQKWLPRLVQREVRPLTVDQSLSLLKATRHLALYWPIMIALMTGMRRGEILALRWRNVDLAHRIIRVIDSLEETKAGLRIKAPKNGRSRAVALPAFAVAELQRLKRLQAADCQKHGTRHSGEALVCPGADGNLKQPTSLTREFRKLIAHLAEIPRIRFHDLRHTHASQLLLAGGNPIVVQHRLGHLRIRYTLDFYAHVTAVMQEEAIIALDAAYRTGADAPMPTPAGCRAGYAQPCSS